MLNSKFYLYKTEWLDLVFDNRNKEYGAYDLRKHYARNMVKAMGIAFFSVSVLFVSFSILHKPKPVDLKPDLGTIVQIQPPVIAHPNLVKPRPVVVKPAASSRMIKDVPMVVAPDPKSVNPPKTEILNTAPIGPVTIDLPATGDVPLNAANTGTAGGTGIAPKASNDPVNAESLEVMPQPFGGAEAWAKFLQKNLRYPGQAIDGGKSGKVWVSFIVERDGHLSNIVLERGAGFGMDEEAMRVLKLAPAWKHGIQNGQPVRVKYDIPINFQLSEE